VSNFYQSPGSNLYSQGQNEMIDLLLAWGGTSLAFAIALSGGNVFQGMFVTLIIVSALTCGLGFVVHELAHRVVARSYGAEAHFASNNGMLVISLLVAFTGFFIAAPGAVYPRGHLSQSQMGLVALAGPVSNLVLAAIFLLLSLILGGLSLPFFVILLLNIGYTINAWLGLFNMIPVDPIDGGKIIRWNKVAFGITVAVGILMVFGRGWLF
jgi:Zn-dependent protease